MIEKNEDITSLINHACKLIRCGHEGAANDYLAKVFDKLLNLPSTLPVEKLQYLMQLLPVLHDAQQRRDNIYLADLLQFEVLKTLE